MKSCPKCGCEIDDMAECCPGCITSVQSLLSAIEGSYEGMKHSDLVETCKMLARGRAAWQREYEAEKLKVKTAECPKCGYEPPIEQITGNDRAHALWNILVALKRGFDSHVSDPNKLEIAKSEWKWAVEEANKVNPNS